MAQAAAGVGRPMKYRLSSEGAWMLNRASRAAPVARYRNGASDQGFGSDDRAQMYARSAGAIPNEITSARESNWTPKSLVVPVSLATQPSTRSSRAAMNRAIAAHSNSPWMLRTMAM